MRSAHSLIIIFALILITGCTSLSGEQAAKPVPTEYLPTIIAQTLEARGIGVATSTPPKKPSPTDLAFASTENFLDTTLTFTPIPTTQHIPMASSTWTPTFSPTPSDLTQNPNITPSLATPTASSQATTAIAVTSIPGQATDTPAPFIPDARVQIYWLGELSKVTAPIQVYARLTSQTGEIVRVELYGEDGRLLARQVKVFYTIPWQVAGLDMELDFEISTAAEIGRLVISVEDSFGRLVDVNSVNLVLLSDGETVLNPASALWQRIHIQEPGNQTLIQGAVLLVSGLARPDTDQPLRVTITDESGRILGQRLVGVGPAAPGGYGAFAVEVPYNISDSTPALVSVYEEGGLISNLSHLASIQVILSP